MTQSHLPQGYLIRPAQWADLQAVTRLIIASDVAATGISDMDEAEMRSSWETENFDLATDTRVVLAPTDHRQPKVVGYEELWNRSQHASLAGDGYVHPEYTGMGIGTALLRWLKERAQEHLSLAQQDKRVYLRNGLYAHDQAGIALHEAESFQAVRYFYRMQIDLSSLGAQPELPGSLRLRTCQPGQDERRIFDTLEDAFLDHWGHTPSSYSQWRKRHIEDVQFDRHLWYVIEDGDQIAAAAICRFRPEMEAGWVSSLGVRQPWRRQGLGLALLQRAFHDFYQRGIERVALAVDATSPTGATRLYERAGMQVVEEYVVYEIELRPGEELANGKDL